MATTRQELGAEARGAEQGRAPSQTSPPGAQQMRPGGEPSRHVMRVTKLRRRQEGEGRPQGGARGAGANRTTRGFGWFSIGLGLAEIAAPKGLAKLIGVRPHPVLFRALGLREIASGIGLLSGRRPAAGMWARVAGDAMDLALLGAALTSTRSRRGRVLAATGVIAGTTALDAVYARQLSSGATTEGGATRVKKSVTIERSPEELYAFWRDFENLPRFMDHLESVRVTDEKRSHWVAKAPAGTTVEWDAEITDDQPNRMIAWRSLEGADVDNSGSVRFEPATAGRGTVVNVEIEYNPPGGALGAAVAKLFGEEPNQQVQEDLRRFKQLMEAGETATTEGQSSGRG